MVSARSAPGTMTHSRLNKPHVVRIDAPSSTKTQSVHELLEIAEGRNDSVRKNGIRGYPRSTGCNFCGTTPRPAPRCQRKKTYQSAEQCAAADLRDGCRRAAGVWRVRRKGASPGCAYGRGRDPWTPWMFYGCRRTTSEAIVKEQRSITGVVLAQVAISIECIEVTGFGNNSANQGRAVAIRGWRGVGRGRR